MNEQLFSVSTRIAPTRKLPTKTTSNMCKTNVLTVCLSAEIDVDASHFLSSLSKVTKKCVHLKQFNVLLARVLKYLDN